MLSKILSPHNSIISKICIALNQLQVSVVGTQVGKNLNFLIFFIQKWILSMTYILWIDCEISSEILPLQNSKTSKICGLQ